MTEEGLEKIVPSLDLCRKIPAGEFQELEAENKRLQKALKDIAKFADEKYKQKIPAPSCVEFMTIKMYAEKALKGAEEC